MTFARIRGDLVLFGFFFCLHWAAATPGQSATGRQPFPGLPFSRMQAFPGSGVDARRPRPHRSRQRRGTGSPDSPDRQAHRQTHTPPGADPTTSTTARLRVVETSRRRTGLGRAGLAGSGWGCEEA
ncbi:hypothetical protein F4780DRAFT_32014 [Xylariomycetidae sp. FL0641]|nr:hypothetical protein F4780DRAFT_32014 [Xylariomycetidae sp. FL0641]